MPMSGKSTGQLIGMVGGAIIGGILAYPTGGMSLWAGISLGASLGGLVGGAGGALYDMANPQDIVNEQASIADILMQTSAYGQNIPQIVGKYRLAGNVIDMGEKQEVENREEQGSGKGGGPRQITITKTYTVSLDIALCDTQIFGPIAGIARAWADNTLIYDNTQMSSLPTGWTLYTGTSPQDPDPVFEAIHGVGNVPGYPFLCHIVMEDYNMGQNPRVPNFTFEVYQDESQQSGFTQLLVSPDDGDVWVAVPGLNQVWRYDETTRERTAVVTLSSDPPLATPYGFSLVWDTSGNYLWVGDPITYATYRIDPGTNLVDTTISHDNSFIGNQVESGGYFWIGQLDYQEVIDNDQYYGIIAGYDAGGVAFAGAPIFSSVRSWQRLAVGLDGNIWGLDDEDDGNTSGAIRIDHTDGSEVANVDIGIDKRLTDVLVGADGDVWVCDYTDGQILRIDPGSNTVIDTIITGEGPLQAGLASDGFIWVACEDRTVTRIDPSDDSSETFQSDTPQVVSPNNNIWAQGPSGAMWLCCTADWTVQRFSTTGTTITVRTGASPRAIAAGASNTVWVCCASGDLQQIEDDGTISAPTSASNSRLQDVVGALVEAGGLTTSDYDVTNLPNDQVILALVNVLAIRAALEQLAVAHNFQLIESNRQLVFKQRGREAVVVSIPETDLDASAQQGETPGLAITRMQEAELPTTLSFNYTSPTRNYQTNTQMAFVSNSQSPAENGRVMSTSVGLSDLQAKQRAQELLDRIWVERNSYQFKVGRKYAYLEAMDRIQVTSRSVTHTLTIVDVSYGRPGILEIQGKSDSAATQYVIGALPGSVNAGGQLVGYLAHTIARLLNLPALGNTDQVARYHVAYQYASSGWPGATLHRSPDGGTTYAQKHSGIIKGIVGTVEVALADADWHFLDEVSTFTVYMISGTLSSISDTVLYSGSANVAMLGDELLQFGVATLVDTNTYTCSRLLRGRRGTEWAVSGHGSNEEFTIIDGGVYRVEHDLSERNYAVPFKTVTNGLAISTVTPQNFAPSDENLVPWQIFPEDELDIGTDDWTITWVLRSRFFGDWVDLDGVGFDPDFICFRLVFYSDNTFTTIVRTEDTDGGSPLDPEATKEFVYTSAMQTADHGSPQTEIYYKAYQVASGGVSYSAEITGA